MTIAESSVPPEHGIEQLEKLAIEYYQQARYEEASAAAHLVLSQRKKTLGLGHPDVAKVLNNLALIHKMQGHFAEAETLYQQALDIREKALGPDHPEVAASLNNLGELYRAQGRDAKAEPLCRRALAISERALGPEHPDVARSLNSLALLYSTRGNLDEAEPLYRRALATLEKALGFGHPDVAILLANLAELERARGRYGEAERLHRRALAIREKALDPDHPDVGGSLEALAGLMQDQGRYAEAEGLFHRALGILEKALGTDHSELAGTLNNLASLLRVQGHYGEAEPLYQRALAIAEKAPDLDPSIFAVTLSNLALVYRSQGRYREAEPLYRRAVDIYEDARGPSHRDLATMLNNLAGLLWAQERSAEAEPLYRRALKILEGALSPDHPDVATSMNNLAALFWVQGHYGEAEPLNQQALKVLEKAFGLNHPEVARSLNNLASLYRRQGRYGEAEPLYHRALAIQGKTLGPDHPDVAATLHNLAFLYDRQEQHAEALALVRRATAIGRRRAALGGQPRTSGALTTEQVSLTNRYRFHLDVLNRAMNNGVIGSREGAAEGFEVAQLASRSRTERAIVRMAARFATGEGTLARLAREREDALDHWQASEEALMREISKSADQRRDELESHLRAQMAKAEADVNKADVMLVENFPRYAELVNPRPLDSGKAQALLGAEEALIVYVAGEEASHVVVLRRDNMRLLRLGPSRQALTETVSVLRAGLHSRTARSALPQEGAADACRDLETQSGGRSGAGHFDFDRAHQLYLDIWAPFELFLVGIKRVFVVPDRALESLPFHVLVTRMPPAKPKGPQELRGVEWLAKREYAVGVLPSVSGLGALRELATKTKPGANFIGFGNPVLGGKRSPELPAVSLDWRGTLANVDDLRSLKPLPDSATELEQLALSLSRSKTEIFLGPRCTERQVKALSVSGDLGKAGVVVFATHGAMAGELKGFNEPGLVLTPPEQATEEDDGFLTASEIAQLNLNADWVILSACNTAATDGTPGAEGFSGLARAFFYAGARTLLVSHWSVYSEAAVKLTTGTFGRLKQDPLIGRAEALRRTMVELIHQGPDPSPAYWAPFVIVGEANV